MNSSEISIQPESGELHSTFSLKIVAVFELLIALISFVCLPLIIIFWFSTSPTGGESPLQQLFYHNLSLLNSFGFFVVSVARVMTLPTATSHFPGPIGYAVFLYFIYIILFLILGLLGLLAGLGILFKKMWAIEASLIFIMYFSLLGIYWISLIGILAFFMVYKHRIEEFKTVNWIKGKLKFMEVGFSDDDELYWLNRGTFLCRAQEYSKAEQALRKSLEYNPDQLETLYNLGLVLIEQHCYSEAESTFRHIVLREKTDFLAWYQLGNVLYAQYKVEQSKKAWEFAVKYSPGEWREQLNIEKRLKSFESNTA